MQIEINRNFIRQLKVSFEDVLTPPRIGDIAEISGLSPGAVANAIHGKSTSPDAIEAAVSEFRNYRNLLNRFLEQFSDCLKSPPPLEE